MSWQGCNTPCQFFFREGEMLVAAVFWEDLGGRTALHAMPVLLFVLCIFGPGLSLLQRFFGRQAGRAGRQQNYSCTSIQRWTKLPPDKPMGLIWPPFCCHQWRRASHWPGSGHSIRLHARLALAGDWRLPCGRGPGHAGAGGIGSPGREITGGNRAR